MKKYLLLLLLLGCSKDSVTTVTPPQENVIFSEDLHFNGDVFTQWGGGGQDEHYLRLEDSDSLTVIKSTGYNAPQTDYYTVEAPIPSQRRIVGIQVTFQGLYHVGEGDSWVVNFTYMGAGAFLGNIAVELASTQPTEDTWTTYTATLNVPITEDQAQHLSCEVTSTMEGRLGGDQILVSTVSQRLLYESRRTRHEPEVYSNE